MAPTQQMKLAAKMKAMQGSGKGLGAEASMTSMVSTGNMSVIKEDADYKSEKSKGNPWVDPMEGLEGAAFRFMAQVEGYLSKEWKLFDRHMRYLSKGMAPGEVDEVTGRQAKGVKVGVTVKQEQLMNEMRQAVGLHINVKLVLLGLSTLVLSLLAVTAVLWLATIDVREQIDGYSSRARIDTMETPTSLDLRLHRLTVPFGPTSTVCRAWKVNYTNDAHITAFEARSLGYPFGASNPQDKVVRTMSLWVSDLSVNATNDASDGTNFECRKDSPAGAAGRLLWHWSRDSGRDTRFVLPPDTGVLLPGVAQLFLQVDYDLETGNTDLRQLTSFDFWQEFEPFDESGIRIELASASALRPVVATLVQVGTMAISVPKLAVSTHNYTCLFSEESPNFRSGAELTVIAASTRTKQTGTAVQLEVTRPHKPVVLAPGAPPPPPGTPPPAPPPPPTRIWSSVVGGNGAVGTHGSDAPALPPHSGLNPRFSFLTPTGQANAGGIEQQPLKLKQGDVLSIQCDYNTRYGLPVDATGGWGRGHELCVTYLLVSPAADVLHPVCGSYALENVDFDGANCTVP